MKKLIYWIGTIISLILGLIGLGLYLMTINDAKKDLLYWPLILGAVFFIQGVLYFLFSIKKLKTNRASNISQFLLFFGIVFSVFIFLSLAYRIFPFKTGSLTSEGYDTLYLMIGISIGVFSLGFLFSVIGVIIGRRISTSNETYQKPKKSKSILLIVLISIFILFILISAYFIIKIFVNPPTSANCKDFYELRHSDKAGVFYRQLHKGMECKNADPIFNAQFCYDESTQQFGYCKTLGDIESYQSKKIVCSRANGFLLFRGPCNEVNLCKTTGCKYDETENICCANYFFNKAGIVNRSKLV